MKMCNKKLQKQFFKALNILFVIILFFEITFCARCFLRFLRRGGRSFPFFKRKFEINFNKMQNETFVVQNKTVVGAALLWFFEF